MKMIPHEIEQNEAMQNQNEKTEPTKSSKSSEMIPCEIEQSETTQNQTENEHTKSTEMILHEIERNETAQNQTENEHIKSKKMKQNEMTNQHSCLQPAFVPSSNILSRSTLTETDDDRWHSIRHVPPKFATRKPQHVLGIQGSFHQGDVFKFPAESVGRQCTCNSLLAICMFSNKSYAHHEINTTQLDRVLELGDALYRKIIVELSQKDELRSQYLMFDELPNSITCENVVYSITKYETFNGVCGAPEFPNEFGISIKEQLLKAFNVSQNNLLMLGHNCIAVFKCADKYCIFDAHPRGIDGLWNEH